MSKLKLDLDELVVESFAIAATEERRGTVHGQAQYTDPRVCSTDVECNTLAVSNCATCGQTCQGTCFGQNTCEGAWTCAGGETCGYTCNIFDGCGRTWDNNNSCDGFAGCTSIGNCW